MCRCSRRLRLPDGLAPDDEIRAAALQYVRKVSGYRDPSPANADAVTAAVDAVAVATQELLAALPPLGQRVERVARPSPSPHASAGGSVFT